MPPKPVTFCVKHQEFKKRRKPRGWLCKSCSNEQDRAWHRKDPRPKMLWDAKRRAKTEDVPFSLLRQDFEVPLVCPVLGIPIYVGNGVASDNSPSMDKIIPKLGYVVGNVAVISSRANRLKSDATVQEIENLLAYLKRITTKANL